MHSSSTPPAAAEASLTYRPDIDGLRAVAILSVLFFHAFPSAWRGGFAGVDIFFVISGYLISSILFKGLDRDAFSFRHFYAHRARRIFPAMVVVLGASLGAGWFFLVPDEFSQLGKHTAAGTGFVQNIVLWKEAGYFDTTSELKPLMHLWSLSVEEQFYLLYPVLIWGTWRLGLNVLTAIAVLFAVSFGLNVAGISQDPVRTFFLPQSRFWELLAGGMLAHVQAFNAAELNSFLKRWAFHPMIFRHPPTDTARDRILSNGLSMLGTLLIVVSVTTLRPDRPFPGWWALAPVGGAVLLIVAGPHGWVNRVFLSNRVMVFIGVISYPLYLWHWPLLSFAHIMAFDVPPFRVRLAMLLLSVALAWLTYRCVERPIRFGTRSWFKTLLPCGLLAAIGAAGLTIHVLNGVPERIPKEVRALLTVPEPLWMESVRSNVCHLQAPDATTYAERCFEKARPSVMLWGDSHAAALYMGLSHLQRTRDFGLIQTTQAGCGPVFELPNLLYKRDCNEINARLLETAKALKPDVLIIDGAWKHRDWPIAPDVLQAKLTRTLAVLKAALPGTRIVVIGPVPQWKGPLNKVMYGYWRKDHHHQYPGQYMAWGLVPDIPRYETAVKASALAENVHYISPSEVLCTAKGCMTRLSPDVTSPLTYADDGHLSTQGSILVINAIQDRLLGAAAVPPLR